MTVFEGFQLTLNCDFIAVADRKYCQVFYGRERLLGEDIAAYTFMDDMSFDKALKTATALSGNPIFEKLWSAKQFDDRPGGYICLKRKQGGSLLHKLMQVGRNHQLRLCKKLVRALSKVHEEGRAHGGLDEDNVIFDERTQSPVILEVLSGFEADQLDPAFQAPEQLRGEPANQATDVYWLGRHYLSTIRRPGHKLRQLIRRCTAQNPEDRPRMTAVAKAFKEIYSQDLEMTFRRWFLNPQLAMKMAGAAMLLMAASMMLFRNDKAEPSLNQDLETNLKAELEKTALVPSSISGIRDLLVQAESEEKLLGAIEIMVDSAAKNSNLAKPVLELLQDQYIGEPNTYYRDHIVHGMSEIQHSQESDESDDLYFGESFEDSLIGIMLFDWPIVITSNRVWQLGDWGYFDGFEGYISKIALNEILIKKGRDVYKLEIETPPGLTRLDWQEKNIYIRPGRSNMRYVIGALKYYDYDVIEIGSGGTPGYIGGYFFFENPDAFLAEIEKYLGLTIQAKTIWIQEKQDLRTFIPIEIYHLAEDSCDKVFASILEHTGIDYVFEPNCDSPLTIYVQYAELRDLIDSMGYQWNLNHEFNKTEIKFFPKE